MPMLKRPDVGLTPTEQEQVRASVPFRAFCPPPTPGTVDPKAGSPKPQPRSQPPTDTNPPTHHTRPPTNQLYFMRREIVNAGFALFGLVLALLVLARMRGWACLARYHHRPRKGTLACLLNDMLQVYIRVLSFFRELLEF
jgi:hypothetical protein